jgi:hypothetical protein
LVGASGEMHKKCVYRGPASGESAVVGESDGVAPLLSDRAFSSNTWSFGLTDETRRFAMSRTNSSPRGSLELAEEGPSSPVPLLLMLLDAAFALGSVIWIKKFFESVSQQVGPFKIMFVPSAFYTFDKSIKCRCAPCIGVAL